MPGGHGTSRSHEPPGILGLGEAYLLRLQGTAFQKAEISMTLPSHLTVWAKSTSNLFPSGGSRSLGQRHLPGEGPVTLVTTVIQSPLPNWTAYGSRVAITWGFTRTPRRSRQRTA